MTIRVGILGYGNLGRGIECAIQQNEDMELVAIFTRRAPLSVSVLGDVLVEHVDELQSYQDKIDVLILCGGSATDLPKQTPDCAKYFHVVDSYDTHASIPQHFELVDSIAKKSQHVALISGGWDPGLFSLHRLYASSILPKGETYTFWGKGVSQGHSDAIRRLEGVKDAKQYTLPIPKAVERVRNGEKPNLTVREKHTRDCYVVAEEGANLDKIREAIVTMPNYFSDYDTTVTFISEAELLSEHSGIPHGGNVIRSGKTGWEEEHDHIMEYQLTLDSNPEFTASVLVAYARAVHRFAQEGNFGCKTVFDVAPTYLSPKSDADLRAELL